MDFKKSILTGLAGAILGFFSHILIQNLSSNSKQNDANTEPNTADKINIQTPTQEKIETDSIKISQTDSLK